MSVVLTRAIRIKFGVDEEVWRGARPDELVGTKYTGNWSLGRAAELDILGDVQLSPNDGGQPAVPAGKSDTQPSVASIQLTPFRIILKAN